MGFWDTRPEWERAPDYDEPPMRDWAGPPDTIHLPWYPEYALEEQFYPRLWTPDPMYWTDERTRPGLYQRHNTQPWSGPSPEELERYYWQLVQLGIQGG